MYSGAEEASSLVYVILFPAGRASSIFSFIELGLGVGSMEIIFIYMHILPIEMDLQGKPDIAAGATRLLIFASQHSSYKSPDTKMSGPLLYPKGLIQI
jgi:hypothetical protein